MDKITTVYCLFEQSGTFKDAFVKHGIAALDFDIVHLRLYSKYCA